MCSAALGWRSWALTYFLYRGFAEQIADFSRWLSLTSGGRTCGAALPVDDERERDRRLGCEFFRLAFPSLVRDVCGPHGSSEYTQRAGVLGGVR
jgi:hypothetical protein